MIHNYFPWTLQKGFTKEKSSKYRTSFKTFFIICRTKNVDKYLWIYHQLWLRKEKKNPQETFLERYFKKFQVENNFQGQASFTITLYPSNMLVNISYWGKCSNQITFTIF